MSHHGMELQRRIVNFLRADTILADPAGSMLFPDWAPQINGDDLRVYEETIELPEHPDVREALPRILVGVRAAGSDREQRGAGDHEGPAVVDIRVVTPKEESQLCDEIAARVSTLIASTWLSDARIIAAELVPDGRVSKGRISAFNGAWEILDRYSTENVGVVA